MCGRASMSQFEQAASPVDAGDSHTRTMCRVALVACLLVALLLIAVSTASASSTLYWYGENNSTCWQTGTIGEPSQACSEVGPSYLLSHLNGSDGSPSGDYCVYYNIGEGLDTTNENNQSAFSGFTPPSPLGAYQEGNHYGGPGPDVCQASGSKWGQVVRGNSANSECGTGYAPCGMQHLVSFAGQELNDRPWSFEMGSPALVISSEADPHKVEAPNSWGYVCPLLKETAGAGHILEFCLEQWHVGWGQFPKLSEFDEATECNHGLGQVITAFKPGTKFAEMVSGSAETFEFTNNPASRTFTARITAGELVLAIEALEKKCGQTEKSSHNAGEYALIGVTQGVEGGSNVKLIGSETANLQLRSEYTPLKAAGSEPFALREPNTGNEDIFYRGTNNALWQEAWTPSSGWKAPYEIGGDLTSKPMGFIEPNGTMNVFYRGANHAIWQAYRESDGHWSTYEVLAGAPISSGKPAGYMEPNGTINIFYCSASNVISQLYYTGSSWTDPGMAVGEAAPCAGDPSAYLQPSGEQNVFYRTTSGNVGQVWYSSGWHNSPIEVGGNVTGTVGAYLESNGLQNVFYRTTSNSMGQVWYNSEGWHNNPLGGQVYSNPAAFVTPNGVQHVFYVNNYGTIAEFYDGASGWESHELGEATEGDPSGFASPGGEQSVFFEQAGAGVIDQWYYNASGEWNLSTVGPGSPPPLIPPAVSTGTPSSVQETQAQLNGTVNPKGTEAKYYFEYGTTTQYGSKTAEGNAGSGVEAEPVSATITGLHGGTTYHYRLIATNPDGTSKGEDRTLTTTAASSYSQLIDSGYSLNAISCIASTTDCTVSDSAGKALYSTNVSASQQATWSSWSGPSGKSPSQAVDCPSSSVCLLADGHETEGGNLYYATALGGAFTTAYEPTYGVDAISCPSSSFCVDGQDGEGYFRYSTSPASTSWTLEQQGSAAMKAVFCLSSAFCAIADSKGDVHVATSESQVKSSSWKETNVDGTTVLHGVTCTSTTSCLAVDAAGNVLNLSISSEGVATVAKHDIDGSTSLTAITCASATCTAVDSAGNIFISTNKGESFTKSYAFADDLTGVSCASSSLCTAVDTTGKVISFDP
jgi:hypothetical protein